MQEVALFEGTDRGMRFASFEFVQIQPKDENESVPSKRMENARDACLYSDPILTVIHGILTQMEDLPGQNLTNLQMDSSIKCVSLRITCRDRVISDPCSRSC